MSQLRYQIRVVESQRPGWEQLQIRGTLHPWWPPALLRWRWLRDDWQYCPPLLKEHFTYDQKKAAHLPPGERDRAIRTTLKVLEQGLAQEARAGHVLYTTEGTRVAEAETPFTPLTAGVFGEPTPALLDPRPRAQAQMAVVAPYEEA